MFDIVSIGAATVDILLQSESISLNQDLLFIPRSSKNEISRYSLCSGGGATNSSVSFSRLGLSSACIAQVGPDPLSSYITADLTKNGVENLTSANADSTDFSVILVASDGSRSIFTNRGSTSLGVENIPWDKLEAKWFYLTSLEGNLDLLEKIIGFAQEKNIKVSFNPGSRELQQKKRWQPLLKFIDFLLLNRSEAQDFTGEEDIDSILQSLALCGCPHAAVTNGREGAHIVLPNKKLFSPIINTQPIDETGAGDSFGSAYVAALIKGLPSEEALFWGIKNSASVVSALGAKSGLLTYQEITK